MSLQKQEEPLALTISDQEQWGQCVTEARKHVKNIHNSRMAVAALALKASTLGWGGSRKGQKWDAKIHANSLRLFSKEVGIGYPTLWDWVQVLRLAKRASLPIDDKKLDYGAAKRTVEIIANNPTLDSRRVYEKESDNTRQVFYLLRFLRTLKQFRRWACEESDLSKLPTEQIKELKEDIGYIHHALGKVRIIETK